MSVTIKPAVYGSEADQSWGYKFGVDGLMSPDIASEFLSVSSRQLNSLAAKGLIRKGMMQGGLRRFCERSVREYASSLEK